MSLPTWTEFRSVAFAAIAIVFLTGVSFFSSPQPSRAAAPGINSFGGRIIAIYPACLNGGIWVSVLQTPPKQPSVISLIWTPATVTRLWGPPKNIGQQVLGLFDTPYTCVVSVTPPISIPGFRMTTVGTSLF